MEKGRNFTANFGPAEVISFQRKGGWIDRCLVLTRMPESRGVTWIDITWAE